MNVKIWGSPGTGKTTSILKNILEYTEKQGHEIDDMTITSFRRNTVGDLRNNIEKLLGVGEKKVKKPVNTIHGICYDLLEYPDLIESKDYREFEESFGVPYSTGSINMSDPDSNRGSSGTNQLYVYYAWMKNTRTPVENTINYPDLQQMPFGIDFLQEFYKAFDEYKQQNGLIDFSDMIELAMEDDLVPESDVLMVDEFQDLTKQQYDIIQQWDAQIEDTVVAGDPLQSIYSFWGGSPEYFQEFNGELQILDKSHRLPPGIWQKARKVQENIDVEPPEIEPKGGTGEVIHMDNVHAKTCITQIPPNKEVLHLVRANYQAKDIAYFLAQNGILFDGLMGWTEKQLYLLNAFIKARNNQVLGYYEWKYLIEKLGIGCFDLGETKEEFLKRVDETAILPNTVIKNDSLNEIINGIPLTGKRDLNFYKIMGGLTYHKKPVSSNDIKHQILTIHGAKGLEADYTVLHTLITGKIRKAIDFDPVERRNEANVWYVGSTRSREKLYVVRDKGLNYNLEFGGYN